MVISKKGDGMTSDSKTMIKASVYLTLAFILFRS